MYDSSSVVSATLRVGVEDMPFCSPPDGSCQRLPAATLLANIILVGSDGVSTAQRQLSRLAVPKAAASVPSNNNGHLGNSAIESRHGAGMNELPKSGGGKGHLDDRLWVWSKAVRQGAFRPPPGHSR